VLSPRLNTILAAVERWAGYQKRRAPTGEVVLADIGSDHAIVPMHALNRRLVDRVVASEVAAGPYHRARGAVEASGWSARVDVRLGDGLEVLAEGEAQLILVAGMGGRQIAAILEAGESVVRATGGVAPPVLVLQPMSHEAALRSYLLGATYVLGEEKIVVEPPHYYQLVVASRENPRTAGTCWYRTGDLEELIWRHYKIDVCLDDPDASGISRAILDLGPINLLKAGSPALEYTSRRRTQLEAALTQFEQGGGSGPARHRHLMETARAWRRLEACLSGA